MNVIVELDEATVAAIAEFAAEIVLVRLAMPQRESPNSPYLSIPEAAAHLRCSRQRIDDLLSQRRLTRYKDGRRTLVSRDQVEAYLRGK